MEGTSDVGIQCWVRSMGLDRGKKGSERGRGEMGERGRKEGRKGGREGERERGRERERERGREEVGGERERGQRDGGRKRWTLTTRVKGKNWKLEQVQM